MLNQPLADRIRPKSLSDVAGDPKLFGEKGIFASMIASGYIPNMIFFGPSGTGKTTVLFLKGDCMRMTEAEIAHGFGRRTAVSG